MRAAVERRGRGGVDRAGDGCRESPGWLAGVLGRETWVFLYREGLIWSLWIGFGLGGSRCQWVIYTEFQQVDVSF